MLADVLREPLVRMVRRVWVDMLAGRWLSFDNRLAACPGGVWKKEDKSGPSFLHVPITIGILVKGWLT